MSADMAAKVSREGTPSYKVKTARRFSPRLPIEWDSSLQFKARRFAIGPKDGGLVMDAGKFRDIVYKTDTPAMIPPRRAANIIIGGGSTDVKAAILDGGRGVIRGIDPQKTRTRDVGGRGSAATARKFARQYRRPYSGLHPIPRHQVGAGRRRRQISQAIPAHVRNGRGESGGPRGLWSIPSNMPGRFSII